MSFEQHALAAFPVALTMFSADGQCVQANQAMADAAGATVDQLLAQNFRSVPTWKVTGLLETAERVMTTGLAQ